eukprot:COSAG01_NODE_52143_length_349_cov_0.372000_1_plen_106_part_10
MSVRVDLGGRRIIKKKNIGWVYVKLTGNKKMGQDKKKNPITKKKKKTTSHPQRSRKPKRKIKKTKKYRTLVIFLKQGELTPGDSDNRDAIMILPPIEQYLVKKKKR